MLQKIFRFPARRRVAFAHSSIHKSLIGPGLMIAIGCMLAPGRAVSQPTTTFTTLNVTRNVNQLPQRVIQAPLGVPVTLNATVKLYNGTPAFSGTVVFCDGSVTLCLAGHALGSQSLVIPTSPQTVGTAHLTITPTPGTHKYEAVFMGNGLAPNITAQSSQSVPYTFKVIGPYGPTTTTLAGSGSPGNYTLNAKVTAMGSRTIKPTGSVHFYDTSNSNFDLGSALLGPTTFSFGFSGPVTIQQPPQFPSIFSILTTVADVNNDGLPDLIMVVPDFTVPYQYDIVVLLNSITGFTVPTQFTPIPTVSGVPTMPTAIAASDINNDGNVDLLVAFDNESLLYFFGTGVPAPNVPAFAPQPTALITPNGSFPYITSLEVADLSNTGFKSIFGTTTIGSFVLPNTSTGGSITWGSPLYTFLPDPPSAIAVGDVNGDGLTDYVVANPDTNDLTLFVQTSPAQFQQIPQNIPAGTAPSALTIADFNGDGIPDIAVTNMGDEDVNILLGNNANNTGKNSNFSFTSKSTPATVSEPMFLTKGDFDGDGKMDLAVGNWDGLNITVLLGKGDGTFKKTTLNGDSSFGLLSADVNFDGFPDIIGIGPELLDVAVFEPTWTANTSASLSGVKVVGPGTHQVDAGYPGDTNYSGSTSNTVPLTGAALATALQLAANPSPNVWGQQVTLTARLAPYSAQGHTTDGESVTFYIGATKLGTAPLSLGVATLTVNSPAVGTHTLKAVYAGDTDFAGSLVNISLTTGKAPSTTALSAANSHPTLGTSDLLTAQVTGFSAPRGNVVFKQDGNTLCTVPLNLNGKATCSYTPWSTSAAHLTATYQGDNNHAASTSSALTLTAGYTYDQSVVMRFDSTQLTYPGATNTRTCVTPATNATPTGTIQIYDSANVISTLSLGGDGCAYWWISPGLSAGTHYIRAHYSGDGNNPAGYSNITTITVNRLQSYMSVACWNSSFSYGGNYQCNVSVWANYSVNPPGNVTYSLDGGPLQTAALTTGNTSFVITKPAKGNHNVVIGYPGSANYSPASAPTQYFNVY